MKWISYLATLSLFVSLQTIAQDKQPPTPSSEPEVALTPVPGELSTKVYRTLSRGTVMAHVSPLSTWLPMKWGFNAGYISSENWTWEIEYTHRSISTSLLGVDIGKIEDQRYGVQARWYPDANSFHLLMGLFKNTFSFELGNDILSHMASTPSITMWKFESWGPQLGLGNRWQWSQGITFGVDWFVMYIPMFNKRVDDSAFQNVSNQSDRDDLDKISRAINNIPQFDIARLHLGYTF